ncbi:alpha subunit of pyruvate dehydrogenase [Binucleata daphniae]
MIRLRYLEQEAYLNYDKMRGFLHLTIGQECIYAALQYTLANKIINYDFIGSYRCHTLAYITKSSIQSIANELLGKKSGMCKGKGGSMHLYNKNFFGGHGIVGAQVPLGTGLAFAINYKKNVLGHSSKKAVFAFFGDGASNQGQVYESYNLALIYKLPIVFVIENNRYGMWTANTDVSVSDEFYKRWNEMRGIRVKTNSFFVISSVIKSIVTLVHDGPVVLQIDTYRHCGHAMNDLQHYRTEQEKKNEKENDCIEEIYEKLHKLGHSEDCENIKKNIEKEIKTAFENATNDSLPNENELYTDIIKE